MVAPIGVTAAQAGAKPSPTAQAGAPTKSASQAGATPAKAAAGRSAPRRRRLAAHLRPAERRQILVYQPQIASWDKQTHLVAFSAVSQRAEGRRQAGASAPSRSKPTRRSSVTERLVSFQKMKIVEANFQTLQKEQVREIADRDRQGDSRRRARDRARSRARESRQEPGHPEERRGREGRSPDDLLQHDAGGDREPRWRADLEPDQGERPEVRGQHELGSVPVRADEHAIPAQQRHAG